MSITSEISLGDVISAHLLTTATFRVAIHKCRGLGKKKGKYQNLIVGKTNKMKKKKNIIIKNIYSIKIPRASIVVVF